MNCVAGDLAIIKVEVNRGAWVDVIELARDWAVPAWICRTLSPVECVNSKGVRIAPPGTLVVFADEELQPIRGQRQADVLDEERVEAVPA